MSARAKGPSSKPASPRRRVRLLIVDDSPVLRQMAREMLEPGLFETVAEAGSGREALAAVRRDRPDLVLLDLSIPDMDGLAFLEALGESGSQAKVLVMTANTQKATAERALGLKAVGVLYKPFELERFREALRRASEGLE